MSQARQARKTRHVPLDCPSAPIDSEGAHVFAVVARDDGEPEVHYLEEPVAVTKELLALAEGLPPAEVFRSVSRCAESKCKHFSGSHCKLGEQLARDLPVVASGLPPCSIRTTCRWFAEQGPQACVRCPQVVTDRPVVAVESLYKSRRQLPVV